MESCVRLSRGQKHSPGGAAGGRSCAGAGLPAPAGRRSARDVGVVLPQRANPGYLTRRAAGAEHHLNPRRERARPPGACRAVACRPCPAAGSPTVRRALPRRLSPASTALKVTPCPDCTVAARCTLRLPGGRTGESPGARHPALRPPERARPRLAAPRRERSDAAPATKLLPVPVGQPGAEPSGAAAALTSAPWGRHSRRSGARTRRP